MSPHLDALLAGPIGSSLQARATSGELELPVLPTSASQVLALCNGDSCDARELASKIESDQSLTGHVLRVSNSAVYAPNEPIISLSQAVARLGFSSLCEITLAVAVRGKVFNVPGFQPTLERLWKHSAVSGAFSKEIARTLRKNVEGAFLCGLLHDIGKPVVLQLLIDVWKEAGVSEPLEIDLAEEVMDHFNGVIGGALLQSWNFAPWMQAAVEFAHNPNAAGEFLHQAQMTHLANELANWALEIGDATEESLASLPVVAELEIYEDDFDQLLARKDSIVLFAESLS
ncbi:MAG: HD-like signal output (HDOD) protein [Planctomycetota bacterium]|jgi:HD-like signal output (HDOD) protein